MQVRILKDTEYAKRDGDNFRCVGQLLLRPSRIAKEVEINRLNNAGEVVETIQTTKTICGPMVTYFPKGATPDLQDDVAREFVAAGIAESIDLDVRIVTTEQILGDTLI